MGDKLAELILEMNKRVAENLTLLVKLEAKAVLPLILVDDLTEKENIIRIIKENDVVIEHAKHSIEIMQTLRQSLQVMLDSFDR